MAIEPETNSVAYQSASRSPKKRGGEKGVRPLFSRPEDIANPAHGVQQLLVERPIDLLAQPADQDVHDVGLRIEVVLPDMRQNHRLRDDAPDVAHQVFEQRELARPQI